MQDSSEKSGLEEPPPFSHEEEPHFSEQWTSQPKSTAPDEPEYWEKEQNVPGYGQDPGTEVQNKANQAIRGRQKEVYKTKAPAISKYGPPLNPILLQKPHPEAIYTRIEDNGPAATSQCAEHQEQPQDWVAPEHQSGKTGKPQETPKGIMDDRRIESQVSECEEVIDLTKEKARNEGE